MMGTRRSMFAQTVSFRRISIFYVAMVSMQSMGQRSMESNVAANAGSHDVRRGLPWGLLGVKTEKRANAIQKTRDADPEHRSNLHRSRLPSGDEADSIGGDLRVHTREARPHIRPRDDQRHPATERLTARTFITPHPIHRDRSESSQHQSSHEISPSKKRVQDEATSRPEPLQRSIPRQKTPDASFPFKQHATRAAEAKETALSLLPSQRLQRPPDASVPSKPTRPADSAKMEAPQEAHGTHHLVKRPAVFVLLTMAVSVNVHVNVSGHAQVRGQKRREFTYARALAFWAGSTTLPIVVAENTGADLGFLEELVPPHRRPSVEFLSLPARNTHDIGELPFLFISYLSTGFFPMISTCQRHRPLRRCRGGQCRRGCPLGVRPPSVAPSRRPRV